MDELRAAKPKIHSPHACFPAVNSCPFHSGLSAMSLVSLCFLLVRTPYNTHPIHRHCSLGPTLYAPAPHTPAPRGTPLLTPSTPSRPPPHTPSPLGPPLHTPSSGGAPLLTPSSPGPGIHLWGPPVPHTPSSLGNSLLMPCPPGLYPTRLPPSEQQAPAQVTGRHTPSLSWKPD